MGLIIGTADVAVDGLTVTWTGAVLTPANCKEGFPVVINGQASHVDERVDTTHFTLKTPVDTGSGLDASVSSYTTQEMLIATLNARAAEVGERLSVLDANGRGLFYYVSGDTGANDPGPTYVSFNDSVANPSGITAMYIDVLDANNLDVSGVIDLWAQETAITIRAIASNAYMTFVLAAGPSNEGPDEWRSITGITYVEHDGLISEGEAVAIEWNRKGTQGEPAGRRVQFGNSTDDADPGPGKYVFDNATLADIDWMYISNEDLDETAIADWVETFDDVPNAASRGTLFIGNPAGSYISFEVVGDVVDGAGYKKVPVAYVGGVMPSVADIWRVSFLANGRDGLAAGARMEFDDATADASPGAGLFRANSATFGDITELYIDNEDVDGSSLATWLDSFDDAVNATSKGALAFQAEGHTNYYMVFDVTGTVVDGTGYRKISVTPRVGVMPVAGVVLGMSFTPSGDDSVAPGPRFAFSTTVTDEDPGAGTFRADSATFGDITQLYIDNADVNGVSAVDMLNALDNVINANGRSIIQFSGDGSSTAKMTFRVTGPVVDGTGYHKVPVDPIFGDVPPDGEVMGLGYAPSGTDALAPGVRLDFSTTITEGDPGAGVVRANNATFADITELYVSEEDLSGSGISDLVNLFDDSFNASSHGFLAFHAEAGLPGYMLFNVTGAVTAETGYLKIEVTPLVGVLPGDGTTLGMLFTPSGEDSFAPGPRFAFDDGTTDADPGSGLFRADNAVFNDVTFLYFNDTTVAGSDATTLLNLLDDASNATSRATLAFVGDGSSYDSMTFLVTGAVIDGTGYFKVPVQPLSGAFPDAGVVLGMMFNLSGNDGLSGALIGVDTEKTDDYTIVPTDAGKVIVANKALAIAFTLDTPGNLGSLFMALISNIGVGDLTVHGTFDNGETEVTLLTGESMVVSSNGTVHRPLLRGGGAGGGGGGIVPFKFETVGDGTATYTLDFTPASKESLIVHVGGVYQGLDKFEISGNDITFDAAIDATTKIKVLGLKGSAATLGSAILYEKHAGTDSTGPFTLQAAPVGLGSLTVSIGGVTMPKDGSAYTLVGDQLTFSEPVPSDTYWDASIVPAVGVPDVDPAGTALVMAIALGG